MKRIVGLAAVLVAAFAAPARADLRRLMDRVQGGAFLHYELTGLEHIDTTRQEPQATELVLAGVRLHGFISENASVAYHIGLDLAAGGTIRDGGFAYDIALFPVGVAVRFGKTSMVAASAGVGAIGATSTIDDAVTLPLEAIAEVGGGRLRLLARARAAYVAGASGRHDGAPSLAFADELDAMLGVRIGHHYDDYGFPSGNGYFIGASYRELAGARFVGLTIGYSIDLAMPRKFKQPEPPRRRAHGRRGDVILL